MSDAVPHVLVVDDSALVRQTMLALLDGHGGFTVAVAADPLIAMRRMAQRRPDVIVLDLEMPRMDGMSFLRRLMAEDPLPVVVCSAFAAPGGGTAAVEALDAGAVDVITKPVLGVRGFLEEQVLSIADTLRGAALARVRRRVTARHPTAMSEARTGRPAERERAHPAREGAPSTGIAVGPIVALGASTGGTQALWSILRAMPADAPPLAVVQHMPAGFTRAFAERLNQECTVEVHEAQDGDRLGPGCAVIAPGDRHLSVRADARGWFAEIRNGPLVSRHRPSVDVLFHSLARAAGPAAIGVLLTGMGDDGAEGLAALRQAGAATLAQDEATCVVFGMPREAIRRGAVQQVLPLPAIAAAILDRAWTSDVCRHTVASDSP